MKRTKANIMKLLVVLSLLALCSGNDDENQMEQDFDSHKVYHSSKDIFAYLDKEKSESHFGEEVEILQDVYYNKCRFMSEPEPRDDRNRKAFIVLEGNYRNIRHSIGHYLEAKMGGKFLLVPPKCMRNYTNLFPRGTSLRAAFFHLASYVSAFSARYLLNRGQNVILNGYWTDQAAFLISKKYRRVSDLPPRGNPLYRFPEDLLLPDLVFYINYPYDQNNLPYTTPSPNYKQKRILIYERFVGVPVVEIDVRQGFHNTVAQIMEQIKIHLQDKRDITPSQFIGDIEDF